MRVGAILVALLFLSFAMPTGAATSASVTPCAPVVDPGNRTFDVCARADVSTPAGPSYVVVNSTSWRGNGTYNLTLNATGYVILGNPGPIDVNQSQRFAVPMG